jgi:isoleucyl-tRNA synthetase
MDLKKTLCLFETTMPLRINLKELDSSMYYFYEENKINEKIFEKNINNSKYILHDGPPYANGPIHLGHAYNKIMKDLCIRSHFMMEYNAYTTPGWDCHGLPIEHKVMQEIKINDSLEIKKACRKYANFWIDNQKESFKKLGVCMDFDKPYKTMNYEYQSDIAKSFATLVEKEYISRSNKTIPWCCGCQTTLATAEIEYQNIKDPSIYVLFAINHNDIKKITNQDIKIISFVIWTTTPWTLPLNRGVMLKKNTDYILIKNKETFLIIGSGCLSHFSQITSKEYKIIETISSNKLESFKAKHPFEEDLFVPIILDDSVTLGDGTACVHTAPGCGPIDYEIGIKNNLEIYSPVSTNGTYTKDIKIKELIDMKISDAQGWVITKLQEKNILWHKGSINHSYPHCWRSKEKLIFRATPQWFCNLEKDNFKEKVTKAIDNITFHPQNSRSFLKSTVLNRWEWCISRQRAWGVPIIALINIKDDSYFTSASFIRYIAEKIKAEGVEYWDQVKLEDLKHILPSHIDISLWRKETNILDVWFDSGISHQAVLLKQNKFPANVYLEGVDQHRGWFQSSLLTSLALNECAPFENIVSCGHTVDEKGQKMSKSIGNVISPDEIIDQIGLDGLRMWVSSVNLGGDIVVGKKIFENIAEVYRKIRNTCRFAVQNLVDFDFEKDMILFDDLGPINQAILKKMFLYQIKIINSYQEYNFSEVFHTLIEICTSFLSSFYFDTIKDILYCDKKNGKDRRATQSTIYIILDILTKLSAPILINTAEDITNHYKSNKNKSIQLESFCKFSWFKRSLLLKNTIFQLKEEKTFYKENIIDILSKIEQSKKYDNSEILIETIQSLRSEIFKATEKLRERNIIKQSIESKITLKLEKETKHQIGINILKNELKDNFNTILCQLFLISEIIIIENFENKENLGIFAEKHNGEKCQRCWKYFYQKNNEVICQRCKEAIE